MTSIFQAIRLNDVEAYNDLISNVDINIVDDNGQSLLHEAISHNNNKMGLDLIRKNINVNSRDSNGQTPLHFAASYGNLELAEAIIQAGGNPDINDKYGNNALWTAVFNLRGKYKLVELYVKAGADVTSKNNASRTPLDFALQIQDEILIAILQM